MIEQPFFCAARTRGNHYTKSDDPGLLSVQDYFLIYAFVGGVMGACVTV